MGRHKHFNHLDRATKRPLNHPLSFPGPCLMKESVTIAEDHLPLELGALSASERMRIVGLGY